MRIAIGAVGLMLAVTAAAHAQPATGLFKWEVSADGGASWRASIEVQPGDTYKMRAWASWTEVPGELTVGFAGALFEQIDLIGADATDMFGGVSGSGEPVFVKRVQGDPRVPDGALQRWFLQTGTGASANGLKLDLAVTTGHVDLAQYPKLDLQRPYSGFDASNPMHLFEMDAIAGDPKVLTISATWYRDLSAGVLTRVFRVYTTETGTSKKPVQEAVMENATVAIVPGPGGAVAMAMTAGLVAMRRRSGR